LNYFEIGKYSEAAREIAKAYSTGYANLLFTNNDLVERDWDSIRNRHKRSLRKQVEEIYSRSGFDLKDSYAKKALELIFRHLDLTQFGIEMNIAIHFFNLLPTVERPVDSQAFITAGVQELRASTQADTQTDAHTVKLDHPTNATNSKQHSVTLPTTALPFSSDTDLP
jgi:hypothetical protein